MARREICVSLRTRRLREAEYRAAVMDGAFEDALRRARANVTEAADLNAVLRGYLREFLERDLQQRIERAPGSPVYAHWWAPGDPKTAVEEDLWAIRNAQNSLKHDLETNNPNEMADYAAELIRKYGLPDHLRGPLTYGLIEAAIRGWEVADRRTLGTEPLVFPGELPPTATVALADPSNPAVAPPAPLATTLIDTFGEWGRKSGGWSAGGENQAKVSVSLFVEVCGDKPVGSYTRVDGDKFRNTLRRLPRVYRKSAADRAKYCVS